MLKNKKDFLFFDTGKVPKKKYSQNYQLGPLSFEYFFDQDKVVTNCGYGSNISEKAATLSKLTSAHSCLCLNETSLLKFEKSRFLNNTLGNTLRGDFGVFDKNYHDDDDTIYAEATHDAYLNNFGYLHKRKIEINKRSNILKGEDKLIKKKLNLEVKFSIRFHLYPGIDAVKTISGDSVLIKIKRNKSLIFSVDKQNLMVEKSIFFARNKILNNLCITVFGKTNDNDKIIKWAFKKEI